MKKPDKLTKPADKVDKVARKKAANQYAKLALQGINRLRLAITYAEDGAVGTGATYANEGAILLSEAGEIKRKIFG